jgi:hypothetical protein
MRTRIPLLCWLLLTSCLHAQTNVETIVCVRHGEKPPAGLGQLTCKGLNRALALPAVLLRKFGKPDYIYAPNPSEQANDLAGSFSYVRPLMTIEPTAIRCGLPVNAQIGFKDIIQLQSELPKPEFDHSVIFVAWEHAKLDQFVKLMMQSFGGNPSAVPDWPHNDYDSIFILHVKRQDGKTSIAFTKDNEGLNNVSSQCP